MFMNKDQQQHDTSEHPWPDSSARALAIRCLAIFPQNVKNNLKSAFVASPYMSDSGFLLKGLLQMLLLNLSRVGISQ